MDGGGKVCTAMHLSTQSEAGIYSRQNKQPHPIGSKKFKSLRAPVETPLSPPVAEAKASSVGHLFKYQWIQFQLKQTLKPISEVYS